MGQGTANSTEEADMFEHWFIENKVPSLASATIIGSGEVRNFHHQFCLDQQDGDNNVGLPVLVFDCTGLKGNQYWYYRSGESKN